jgi:hypothetical protein
MKRAGMPVADEVVIVAVDPQPDFVKKSETDVAKLAMSDAIRKVVEQGQKLVDFGERHSHHAQCEDPYRYLHQHDRTFCGDPHRIKDGKKSHTAHWKRKIQPTEVQIGDTITIGSLPEGHRSAYYIDRSLRVLGVSLPFMVVEFDTEEKYSSSNRHRNIIDVRGATLYANRRETENNGCCNAYQPLLSAQRLKMGDRFIIVRLGEDNSDGSYRGEAFEVTEAPRMWTEADVKAARHRGYSTWLTPGTMAVRVKHLSWDNGFSDTWLSCDKLQIIPCNDQYVAATKTHCPDIC